VPHVEYPAAVLGKTWILQRRWLGRKIRARVLGWGFWKTAPCWQKDFRAQEAKKIEYDIWLAIYQRPKGIAIDDELFKKVGARFGVSASVAKRIYYGGGNRVLKESAYLAAQAMLKALGPEAGLAEMRDWFRTPECAAIFSRTSQKLPK
jgi:hypothetical protein